MIDIIITSYNEPKATLRAVNTILKQKIKQDFRITVVDPFDSVGEFLNKHIKSKKFRFFLDPGEGKSYALNFLFQEYGSENKDDLFILTDGDVYISDNAIEEILNSFKDKQVGAVTGKPVSVDSRKTKYGYWSKLLYDGIDFVRRRLSKKKFFFQCSGYLFAIRKGLVIDFPTNVPEDSVIPYLVWKKGYKIEYAPKAEVYVKYPNNWTDWVNQRVRTIKAHENLDREVPEMPRTKSFFNEIKQGLVFSLKYPKTFREFFWTFQLYFARVFVYLKSFIEMKSKKGFKDGWRETEIQSTKPFD